MQTSQGIETKRFDKGNKRKDILMFCTSCEFEIKGEGRKECPICSELLIEYSELENSSEETKGSWEQGRVEKQFRDQRKQHFLILRKLL